MILIEEYISSTTVLVWCWYIRRKGWEPLHYVLKHRHTFQHGVMLIRSDIMLRIITPITLCVFWKSINTTETFLFQETSSTVLHSAPRKCVFLKASSCLKKNESACSFSVWQPVWLYLKLVKHSSVFLLPQILVLKDVSQCLPKIPNGLDGKRR